jgi:HEAT repeat protein
MKTLTIVTLLLGLAAGGSLAVAADEAKTDADRAIERYLKLPHPEEDLRGEARDVRLQALRELRREPEQFLPAVRRALAQCKEANQRRELTESLHEGKPAKAAAALLTELLKDPDEHVRSNAIAGLRMLSRRTDRFGGKRTVRSDDLKPPVEGLLPVLIQAADDRAEPNRVGALYALADTREPGAVDELRRRLSDPSPRVRLYAACFLTEYDNAAGMPELRAALARLRKSEPQSDFTYYTQAEMLCASLERITRKSFGEIPMMPLLMSDSRKAVQAEKRYRELIDAWAQWWEWEPTDPK